MPVYINKKASQSIWTDDAIYCYKRAYVCLGCKNENLLESQPCQMDKSVLILLRNLGKPPLDIPEEERIFKRPRTQLIYEYIKNNPLSTIPQISKATNVTKSSVNNYIQYIRDYLNTIGQDVKAIRSKNIVNGRMRGFIFHYKLEN
jgi:hypothetical protein